MGLSPVRLLFNSCHCPGASRWLLLSASLCLDLPSDPCASPAPFCAGICNTLSPCAPLCLSLKRNCCSLPSGQVMYLPEAARQVLPDLDPLMAV